MISPSYFRASSTASYLLWSASRGVTGQRRLYIGFAGPCRTDDGDQGLAQPLRHLESAECSCEP
jgi:hypothetical protein